MTSLFSRKTDKLGQALVESATGLSEIHYDQISLTAVRGTDLDILIKQFSLIAPEERIAGIGSITYQGGVPIRAQPLSVDLDVGVRGRLGVVLGILGMLKEGGQDELGYSQLYQQVHLEGPFRTSTRANGGKCSSRHPCEREADCLTSSSGGEQGRGVTAAAALVTARARCPAGPVCSLAAWR